MLTTLSPRFAVPEKVGIRLEICGDIADYRWMLIYSGQFHWRSGFGCCMWIPLIPGSGSERLRRVETVRGRFSWTLVENCTWTWPIQHVQGKPPSRSSSITHTKIYIECRIIVESLCVIMLISLNSGLCLPWQVTSAPRFGVAEVIREETPTTSVRSLSRGKLERRKDSLQSLPSLTCPIYIYIYVIMNNTIYLYIYLGE